jgi:hypothetical protein
MPVVLGPLLLPYQIRYASHLFLHARDHACVKSVADHEAGVARHLKKPEVAIVCGPVEPVLAGNSSLEATPCLSSPALLPRLAEDCPALQALLHLLHPPSVPIRARTTPAGHLAGPSPPAPSSNPGSTAAADAGEEQRRVWKP